MTIRATPIALALMFAYIVRAAAPANAQQLPPTHAKTLSGRAVTLPIPDHPRTLLVAGFSNASSDAVKAWWLQAMALCQAHPAVACYQGAVIEEAPSFIRGMVVSGLKHDVPPGFQDTFVIVVENEATWKQAFGFNAPDDAYLAIVDKTGKLLWKMNGGEKAANSAEIAKGFEAASK